MAQLSPPTAIQDAGIVVCRSEKATLDLDQAYMVGVLPTWGMNPTDEKDRKKEAAPCSSEFRRLLEEYISDLRAVLNNLPRKLN
jgi:hypothetical protein